MDSQRRKLLFGTACMIAGAAIPEVGYGVGRGADVSLSQIVYAGGNWRPRSSALRRLAWEIHKRTAVNAALEPSEVKPLPSALASSPFAYLSGDRSFDQWSESAISTLSRFLKIGGTLVIDPALAPDGEPKGFERSVDDLLLAAAPALEGKRISDTHVLYRTFYQIHRPVGRVKGPEFLTGYEDVDGRLAIIRTHHDLGGAWARDNLGNWDYQVTPGGDRQREAAFRLGVNIVMYSLCLDYKDEQPHRRFGKKAIGQ